MNEILVSVRFILFTRFYLQLAVSPKRKKNAYKIVTKRMGESSEGLLDFDNFHRLKRIVILILLTWFAFIY